MASHFLQRLSKLNPQHLPKQWYYIAYDQLSLDLSPIKDANPDTSGIILIETTSKGRRRPYHKQKLAILLTNMRHFALEAADKGFHVHYIFTHAPYAKALTSFCDTHTPEHPIILMRPAEYELRQELRPLVEQNLLKGVSHSGWLTSRKLFLKSQGRRKSWLMDAFYKHVRKQLNIMMTPDGKPEGGQFSYDKDNRKPWHGSPQPPEKLQFEPDTITTEVVELIHKSFNNHPGTLTPEDLPASRKDALAMLDWALQECMTHFGPYEDAMHSSSRRLFHTTLSPLINLHRLTPSEVLHAVLNLDDIPIQSKEGFVRQLIGWREFMFHVHDCTDGLRRCPDREESPCTSTPGDAQWSAYNNQQWTAPQTQQPDVDLGGASPNLLEAHNPLPAAFWGDESGLFCLDHVVQGVMNTGWSHHIERLMILGNLASLLDISPRDTTDWFWTAFIDAYDWVVEPNVLGMATFAVGDLFTTKPYVSGSNYINKMSDYCSQCELDPKTTCPVTHLYWAFLDRHKTTLEDNRRMGLVYNLLNKRDPQQIDIDHAIFEYVTSTLANGDRITSSELSKLQETHA